MIAPVCPYCNEDAVLTTGTVLYPHRPDLATKHFWMCWKDKAWVGCHPHSDAPLGRLANADLRRAKMAAHAAFDPLWRSTIKKTDARATTLTHGWRGKWD